MFAQLACGLDQPTKVGVHLRSAAGDIHGLHRGQARQSIDTLVGGLGAHDFGARRRGVDVAVPAGLIAELANVDLKDGEPGAANLRRAGGQAHPFGKIRSDLSEGAKLVGRGQRRSTHRLVSST